MGSRLKLYRVAGFGVSQRIQNPLLGELERPSTISYSERHLNPKP